MASAISKRSQARNERALQELIKSVPGNDRCADCSARNPGWASWNLGIFLCMRCAGLHRKLGTHVSKVKSLSMDSWTTDQVDNMKSIGNTESNRKYNPKNINPDIPIDVDEVDGAMERYIRQKYDTRTLGTARQSTIPRQDTASTGSVEPDFDTPSLPQKPKRFKFGLRSASSALPLGRRAKPTPPESPPSSSGRSPSFSQHSHKASRVFGSDVDRSQDDLDLKLSQLRDMGFTDARRNSAVLKAHGGDIGKTVESLMRIGVGGRASQSPIQESAPFSNGLSIQRTRPKESQQGSVQNQSSTTQNQVNRITPSQALTPASNNPFYNDSPQSAPSQIELEGAFQNMNLGQQQNLFPNHTGGFATPGQLPQHNPFYQTYTPPPMPHIPSQYSNVMSNNASILQPQATGAPNSIAFNNSNPYIQAQYPSQPQVTNPFYANMNQAWNTGAAQASLAPQSMPQSNLQQQQQQQHWQAQSHQTDPTDLYYQNQPQQQQSQYQQSQYQESQYQQPQPQYQQAQQYPQPPLQLASGQRVDNNSILALYNYPQLAPARAQPLQQAPNAAAGAPNGHSLPADAQFLKQRSVTAPPQAQAGSLNPFAAPPPQQPPLGNPYAAPAPMQAGLEAGDYAGMTNGRHSPDAFAGLSARLR